MKRAAIFLTMVLSVSFFCSAGGQTEGSSESGEPAAVSMWLMGSEKDSTKQYMTETIGRFKEETGIDVTYQFVSWGDGFRKISTSIAAGEGPDITQVGTTWVANFQATGAFSDLTSEIGKTLPEGDVFTPGAWATAGYGGEIYAIPWYSDVRAQVYRSDLWAEAGYPEGPKNWQDIEDGGRKIKAAHPEIKSVVGFRGQGFGHYVGSLIWQNGGDFISPDGTTATWNDPRNVETMNWFAGLINDGIVSEQNGEWTNDDIISRFWEGEVALMFMGSGFEKSGSETQRAALDSHVAVGPQPAGFSGARAGFVGGSNLMLFDYSPAKSEAMQFMAFLARPEIQELKAIHEGRAPAVKDAYTLPELQKGWWPGFADAASFGRHFPIHPAWGDMEKFMPEIKSLIYSAIIDGTFGSGSVEGFLNDANGKAQRKIEEIGAPAGYSAPWPKPE